MLTAKELTAAGIKPGELFGRILKGCKTIEEALSVWGENQPTKGQRAHNIIENSAWQFLISHSHFQGMSSLEFPGSTASSSEKKRWLENGAVIINGKRCKPDDIVEFPISELVFFPNSEKRRCTMI